MKKRLLEEARKLLFHKNYAIVAVLIDKPEGLIARQIAEEVGEERWGFVVPDLGELMLAGFVEEKGHLQIPGEGGRMLAARLYRVTPKGKKLFIRLTKALTRQV